MNKAIIAIVLCLGGIPASAALADLSSIVQTVEGVESDVKGSVSDVNGRTLSVFSQLGIQSTGVDIESSGSKQTLKGKKENIDVQVHLTQSAPNQTHVIVTAKQGALNWNKDFARQILSKVIQSS